MSVAGDESQRKKEDQADTVTSLRKPLGSMGKESIYHTQHKMASDRAGHYRMLETHGMA